MVIAVRGNIMEFMLVTGAQDSSREVFGGTGLMCANLEIRVGVQWTRLIEINAEHVVSRSVWKST